MTRPFLSALLLAALSPVRAAQEQFGGRPLDPREGRDAIPTVVLDGDARAFGFERGAWVDVDSGRVWRVRLEVPGATSLLVSFDRFALPEGASLFAITDVETRGAFTSLNNRLDGRFALAPMAVGGDVDRERGELTLEYHEPSSASVAGELVVGTVLANVELRQGARQGTAAKCNVDVACEEGEEWADDVRSIVKIVAVGELCTGVLLNNTNGDGTPYVLTAAHCGDLKNAGFFFNWRRETCGEGEALRPSDLLIGSTLLVKDDLFDFQLVRLADVPPAEFGARFAGWDRGGETPASTTTLHHPAGDVMKISVDRDPPREKGTFWRIKQWDVGITQRGSSGAPLFDPEHRVVAHLKGGDATCKDPGGDLFGRLDKEWLLLAPFLDPKGTDAKTLDAFDPTAASPGDPAKTDERDSDGDGERDGGTTLTIDRLDPTSIPRSAKVRIHGTGFTAKSTVFVFGQKVATRWLSNSLLEAEFLGIPPGEHEITVRDGERSATATLVSTERE